MSGVVKMAKQIKKGNSAYYSCEECGFAYETRELAQKCEAWCSGHNSCSLEITKHAINLKH